MSKPKSRDISSFVHETYVDRHVRQCIGSMRVRKYLTINQGTPTWLKFRASHVTSTDAHVILNSSDSARERLLARKINVLDPTKLDMFTRIKNGINEKDGLVSARAMEHGNEYEPVAAALYAQHECASLARVGIAEHPQYQWLACSPDRIDVTHNKLVEIKCAYSRVLPAIKVPTAHWTQMQIAMACTGIHTCAYVECSTSPGTRKSCDNVSDYVIYTRDIAFDQSWFDTHVKRLYEFHRLITRTMRIKPKVFCHASKTPAPMTPLGYETYNDKTTTCFKLNADGSPVLSEYDNMLTSLWNLPPVEFGMDHLPPLGTLPDIPETPMHGPVQDEPMESQEYFRPVQVSPQEPQEPQPFHERHHITGSNGLFTNLYGRRFE